MKKQESIVYENGKPTEAYVRYEGSKETYHEKIHQGGCNTTFRTVIDVTSKDEQGNTHIDRR